MGRPGGRQPGRPYAGSGRGPNFHAVIAWGPGPRPGSARLYWVDTTVPGCNYGTHALTVSYSDDEGATWSRLYVERRTPPWIGGFPEIAVDREPTSPRHGAVYVVYNWLASRTAGPGMRVIASSDFGRTWRATVDIPPAPRPAGCRASWRIGYRAATGPDGSLFVSGYQADLRRWDADRPFAKGGAANVCRLGVTVTRVRLDAKRHRLIAGATVMATLVARSPQAVYGAPAAGTAATTVDPEWCHGLAVDRADGAVYLAVGSYAGTARDRGATGDRPRGREPRRRPDLAVADAPASHDPGPARVRRRPRLGLQAGPRGPRRQRRRRVPCDHRSCALGSPAAVVVGTYVAVSADRGRTFGIPVRTTRARWPAAALERGVNGPGLRDDIDLAADGRVVFVYGDGRLADPSPAASWGRAAVFVAVIDP